VDTATAPAEASGLGTTSATPPTATGIPGLPFVAPGSEIFRVSLLELQSGNPEKNIALRAGDTVFFPRASQVYVMGSVARPGPYRFQEGMTVLQALTLAGGATARGSAGRTKVVRIVDGKKVEKKAKATDFVLPRIRCRSRAVLLTSVRDIRTWRSLPEFPRWCVRTSCCDLHHLGVRVIYITSGCINPRLCSVFL
jgi:hypothetical protein